MINRIWHYLWREATVGELIIITLAEVVFTFVFCLFLATLLMR